MFVTLLVASIVAAASFDPPKRKSGLWEVKISIDGRGGPDIQECVDEKTDDMVTIDMPGGEKPSCSKNEMRKEGDRAVVQLVCKINSSTAKARTVFIGRFDSAYKSDIKSTYDPPIEGIREASSVVEANGWALANPARNRVTCRYPACPISKT